MDLARSKSPLKLPRGTGLWPKQQAFRKSTLCTHNSTEKKLLYGCVSMTEQQTLWPSHRRTIKWIQPTITKFTTNLCLSNIKVTLGNNIVSAQQHIDNTILGYSNRFAPSIALCHKRTNAPTASASFIHKHFGRLREKEKQSLMLRVRFPVTSDLPLFLKWNWYLKVNLW